MSDTGRFGGERPQWPSLRGEPAATTPGGTDPAAPDPVAPPAPGPVAPPAPVPPAPVPAAPAPAAPVPAAPAAPAPPDRRSRRYAAADPTAPDAPVDPAARSAALARAEAALAAGDAGARTAALERADAALVAAAPPGASDREGADDVRGAGPAPDDAPPARGRRRVLLASIVAGVLVLGGGGAAYLLTRDDGAGTVAARPDVVLPSPTATAAPVARTATTPFATALPATVLQYALQTSADDAAWLGLDAVEAYTETYTDGAGGAVTVQAGQWETPAEAGAVLASLTAALPTAPAAEASAEPSADPAATSAAPVVLTSGEVLVGGQPTGAVTVLDAGDGTGVAVWSNGTTVFRVTGPAADIANLYAAYPL